MHVESGNLFKYKKDKTPLIGDINAAFTLIGVPRAAYNWDGAIDAKNHRRLHRSSHHVALRPEFVRIWNRPTRILETGSNFPTPGVGKFVCACTAPTAAPPQRHDGTAAC